MKMRKIKKAFGRFVVLCCGIALLEPFCLKAQKMASYDYKVQSEGISWPEGQAMPYFAEPAEILDGLSVDSKELSGTEKTMFSAFQGLINRKKPRIFLFEAAREGKYKWPDLLNLKINEYPIEKRWELIDKYKDEISGLFFIVLKKMSIIKIWQVLLPV